MIEIADIIIEAAGKRVNESVVAVSNGGRDEDLARVEVATLAAILAITLAGNSTVLVALYMRRTWGGRKKLSRMYYFILHLCIADLVTGLLNVFPQLIWDITYRFRGGPLLCKLVKYGQTLGPYLSSYVLMATAMDRYKAICHPLTYCSWTSHHARSMVQCAWATALLFCIPQVTIFSYMEVPGSPGDYDCWATFPRDWGERAYVTWYSVSVFILPLIVLIYTYWCICRELWRNAGFPVTKASPHRLISRAKVNTVKQTVAVIALYVACSSPFIVAQLWAVWDPGAVHSPFFQGATFTILSLLSSLNSCVNPWIYLVSNKELMRGLRQLLGCKYALSSDYRGNNSAAESGSSGCGAGSCSKRSEVTNTTSLLPRKPLVAEQPLPEVTPIRRWVVTIPPNVSREERECLQLFSGLNNERILPRSQQQQHNQHNQQRAIRTSSSPCRAARCRLDL
ncbi:annetocin receptor isoform X1 [Nilaparvata lugens]|uniref:annetocin receptor isoform X1 n=1 Tax=Nilaparvata lugens TaxID=108931 RepID=UPI00193D174D|nr:annetocin receptor isoform X1 [Nilaparvata lugens]